MPTRHLSNPLSTAEVDRRSKTPDRIEQPIIYSPEATGCQYAPVPRTFVPQEIARRKNIAFAESHLAKAANGEERVRHYRRKDEQINALLRMGYAFFTHIHEEDPDIVLDVAFAGGGRLHTKLGCLDRCAFGVLKRWYTETAGTNAGGFNR